MFQRTLISAIALVSIFQSLCLANNYTNTPGHYEAKFTSTLPVIDGIGNDTCWDKAEWATIDQIWIGQPVDASDFTGKFKAMWTEDRLYVLVRVTDDSLLLQASGITDVCTNIYNYDCVEIFMDENNSRETDYSGTFKAVAYHMDTTGNICYSMGNKGWVRLDDHLHYKMKRVDTHTFDYEYEIKVYNDTYVVGGINVPVKLTNGKLMGWSIAYNDNDLGSTRQNMIGSIYIAGSDKNVSYFNSSVFGELKLVGKSTPTTVSAAEENANAIGLKTMGDKLVVTYTNQTINDKVNIQLFDCSGKRFQNFTTVKHSSFIEKQFDTSGLPKGVYIVKVANEEKSETKKVVIN
ncbi:MAG TPA: sugar-binding protein [Bacteroidales bacterium]|nr:sugar-binding protein [Bacteroidales bacterium]